MTTLKELDPKASYYGIGNDLGSTSNCGWSLQGAREEARRDGYPRVVAWVDGEHIVIPDDWPAGVTVERIINHLNYLHTLINENEPCDLVREINELGVACAHTPTPQLFKDDATLIVAGALRHGQYGVRVSKLNEAARAVVDALAEAAQEDGTVVEPPPKVRLDDVAQAIRVAFIHPPKPSRWEDISPTERTRWQKMARAALSVAGVEWETS